MNAIEIEQAISKLAEQAFDPEEFPYQILKAFGNKATRNSPSNISGDIVHMAGRYEEQHSKQDSF